mmetsp:Transcript_9791/g.10864  ORF Transcript_9791/g.10864 Transcript_9791/m.10864 type:complete len:172 (-) Transcript_9791:42-557(-)
MQYGQPQQGFGGNPTFQQPGYGGNPSFQTSPAQPGYGGGACHFLRYEWMPKNVISRFNAFYFCTVVKLVVTKEHLIITIDVKGNGSMGPIQAPEASHLHCSLGCKTPSCRWVPTCNCPNDVRGDLYFDLKGYLCAAQPLTISFHFGTNGYCPVPILAYNPCNKGLTILPHC